MFSPGWEGLQAKNRAPIFSKSLWASFSFHRYYQFARQAYKHFRIEVTHIPKFVDCSHKDSFISCINSPMQIFKIHSLCISIVTCMRFSTCCFMTVWSHDIGWLNKQARMVAPEWKIIRLIFRCSYEFLFTLVSFHSRLQAAGAARHERQQPKMNSPSWYCLYYFTLI